jgi:hypothetical protein
MRDEIQDQYGNAIYLTDERWEHAEFDEIEVVVIFRWQHDKPNNFIVTAYGV